MIKKEYYKTRNDGKRIYRTYSTTTPTIKQLPTNRVYPCWVYKVDENGNETNEVDWEQSGVFDVENCNYAYEEVIDNGASNN